jgi:hypothetical protein
MSGLQWIRLDTSFPDSPKIMDLVDANQHRVIVGHLSMMCHVGKTGTDGYFRDGALRRYAITKKDTTVALESGLWIPAPGGFTINDWAEYQVADEAATARSEKARRAAEKRWRNQNGGGDAATA